MENSACDFASLSALPPARRPLPSSASRLSARSSENLLELLGPFFGYFFFSFHLKEN